MERYVFINVKTCKGGSLQGPSRDGQQQRLVEKRAWEMALGPLKSLPMNLFMMYMAGNSISIFPIMMVCMMAWRPLKALTATNSTFKSVFRGSDVHFSLLMFCRPRERTRVTLPPQTGVCTRQSVLCGPRTLQVPVDGSVTDARKRLARLCTRSCADGVQQRTSGFFVISLYNVTVHSNTLSLL